MMRGGRLSALGAALVLAGAGGASAGPPALPCGPGALSVPGTGACLTLGGVARAEAATRTAPRLVPASPDGGRRGSAALRAGVRASLDARVPTAAGPLRAYLAVGTGGLSRR